MGIASPHTASKYPTLFTHLQSLVFLRPQYPYKCIPPSTLLVFWPLIPLRLLLNFKPAALVAILMCTRSNSSSPLRNHLQPIKRAAVMVVLGVPALAGLTAGSVVTASSVNNLQ